MDYFSDNGYKLNLTFERGHALLNCVDMGRRETLSRNRIEYTVELIMAEQMIQHDLVPFDIALLNEFTSLVEYGVKPDDDHQVTDNSPMVCANI